VIAVFLFYTVFGFLVVPVILKSQMLKRLPPLTHRTVAVQEIRFNPYTFALTVRGFSLKEPEGADFAGFAEFHINFQLISAFKRGFVFKEIRLVSPAAHVLFDKDGTPNFANLLSTNPPPPRTEPTKPLPLIIVESLSISNGLVSFTDLRQHTPFRTRLEPLHLELHNFTTRPKADAPYSFTATTGEGESFAWAGDIAVNPPSSRGRFQLTGLPLPKYAPYLEPFVTFQTARGTLDVGAQYLLDASTTNLVLNVTNATVRLRELELKDPATGERFVALPDLQVNGGELQLANRQARIGSVTMTNGYVSVRLLKNGSINLLSYIKQSTAPTNQTAQAATTDASPFVARVDAVDLTDFTIQFEDQSLAHPARIKLDQISVGLRNISTLTNTPVTLAGLTARWNEAGTIGAQGTVVLQPVSADIHVNIQNLDLQPVQPYVQEQVNLAITDGALTTTGRVQLAAPGAAGPRVKFRGAVALNKLATIDSVQSRDFVKWDSLQLGGLVAEVQPTRLHLDSVTLTKLDTTLIINSNKQINLTDIFPKKTAATNAPPSTTTNKTKEITITINTVTLDHADLKVRDQSIEPNASAGIAELSGTIRGLSSAQKDRATVDLHGKVDALASFKVTGQINPLSNDLYSDVALLFKSIDLTPASPYMGKYAGFPIQKGKLHLDLHWRLSSNELKAENKVVVDRLTLGQATKSPDATKLPVKLALALLTDRNGKIDLDVPLSGRLDDPKFRVWPIIWQVVMNLLGKAATAPFTLLGKLIGGGAEDLGFIDFAPGSSDLNPAGLEKIQKLAKALHERPALAVEIAPSVDPVADRDALAKVKLLEALKTRRLQELTATNQTPIALAAVTLTEDDRQRLLTVLYTETFGPFTNAAVAITNQTVAPVASATPPAKPAGKVVNFTWGSRTNTPAAATPQTITPATVTNQVAATTQSPAEMEAALLSKMTVTDNDLRQLLKDRAVKVQSLLLQQKEPPETERLFVTNPEIPKPDPTNPPKPRVNLSLQ